MDKYISVSSNNLLPSKGRLLLSEPLMNDYYFGRSVIIIGDHDNEGTFGAVINKPIKDKFNDVVKDFPKFDGGLFIGGPVEPNNLFFVHKIGDIVDGAISIGSGLYWGGDIEIVKDMIEYGSATSEDVRFLVGYSGWSPNQLQSELKRNSWVVSPEQEIDILKIEPKQLWERLLTPLGDKYKHWSSFPTDPGLN